MNDKPMSDHERYEAAMELMRSTVISLLSRGMERSAQFPLNGYRRRIYFEGIVRLAEDIAQISATAAIMIRSAGHDIQILMRDES